MIFDSIKILFPLIKTPSFKSNKIKQFSHPRTYTIAIAFFQFLGIEVGGGMCFTFIIDKEFVSGEQYFTHDVAVLSKVSSGGFYAEVVETEEL